MTDADVDGRQAGQCPLQGRGQRVWHACTLVQETGLSRLWEGQDAPGAGFALSIL